jgi:hypothetical protein
VFEADEKFSQPDDMLPYLMRARVIAFAFRALHGALVKGKNRPARRMMLSTYHSITVAVEHV